MARRARYAKIAADFGARLRALPREAGLSQEALGDLAVVHRTYVSLVERGDATPTLCVVRFAEALAVDPADLARGLKSGQPKRRRR